MGDGCDYNELLDMSQDKIGFKKLDFYTVSEY